ncbi:RNA-binding protein [Clostridium sp. WILCCON 0269]|uniref:RNA-binding protein n=1 Tax=Candidatus Clostridium eludens TaxID=3381663 RepID=A0ABW8SIV9_9CLOT
MDKKTFISRFYSCNGSEILPIYDKIVLAEKTHKSICTSEFYPPSIWKTLENLKEQIGLNVCSYGVFEDAERKLVMFSENEVGCYPIRLMKIQCNSKFVKLQHRDYLGSLMALGLRRGKFGDLIVKQEDGCYIAICEDISDYVVMNLKNIGKYSCDISFLDITREEIPAYNFETFVINSSSLRIDCLISSLCNISRSKSEELLRQGKALLDYLPVTRKDKIVNDGCVITLRGYGKFKIIERLGYTRRGGCKLNIKKFS